VLVKRAILVLTGLMLAVAPPAVAQSKATMQQLNDRWAEAFNKGDAAAVAAMYTADAYVLPAGAEIVKGRPAIEAMWRQNMQQIDNVKMHDDRREAARQFGSGGDRQVHLQNESPGAPGRCPQIRRRLAEGGRAVEASARHLELRQIAARRDNGTVAKPKE
jgi:hypothetical protein